MPGFTFYIIHGMIIGTTTLSGLAKVLQIGLIGYVLVGLDKAEFSSVLRISVNKRFRFLQK